MRAFALIIFTRALICFITSILSFCSLAAVAVAALSRHETLVSRPSRLPFFSRQDALRDTGVTFEKKRLRVRRFIEGDAALMLAQSVPCRRRVYEVMR